ncbi:hypothetical protein Tco_0927592 [Tanacetum coccineum]
MEEDLFTYQVGNLEPSYVPCVEQQSDKLENYDRNAYEQKVCHDKNEKVYAEVVIFIVKRLIDVDVLTKDISGFKTYKDYKNEWIDEWNKEITWVEERPWGIKDEEESKCFDKYEPKGDDDDIENLDDYSIPKDAPYFVNKEDEKLRERRSKLLGMPYMKPPT